MVQKNQLKWFYVFTVIVLIGVLGLGGGLYLHRQSQPAEQIQVFDDLRDTKDILDIFKRDRYWLVSSKDYSPEFMLKYRAATQDMRYLGQLHIDVLRNKDSLIGFVAYYMEEPGKGFLLFLAVNPQFRGKKGYPDRLMNHALAELKKMGATVVNLVTRTDNFRAQNVYKRLKFTETGRDEGFVHYTKEL